MAPTQSLPPSTPLRQVVALAGILSLVSTVFPQEPAKRNFDLPPDAAARTFKRFSEQSGRGLIADADLVRGVTTSAVKGEFTPVDAAKRMLARTGLVAKEDPKNGAFVVDRENPDPNGRRAAQKPAGDRPGNRIKIPTRPQNPI